jgi:hypothetical protein
MGASWRHWAAAGGRRFATLGLLGLLGVVGVVGPVGAATMASDGAARHAAVRPKSTLPKNAVTQVGGQLSAAQSLVASRAAALARGKASTATLAVALSGLRTQGEVLTERYDREVSLEQRAAAAYRVAVGRVAAAKKHQRRAVSLLGQQAAADYEWNAAQSMATVLFAGRTISALTCSRRPRPTRSSPGSSARRRRGCSGRSARPSSRRASCGPP